MSPGSALPEISSRGIHHTSPDQRPAKRARRSRRPPKSPIEVAAERSDNAADTHDTNELSVRSVPASRSRGPAACERCRDRKTKCDFRRPTCGYCAKRQVSCIYADEASDWVVTGTEILTAIGNLSKLVESQSRKHHVGCQNIVTSIPGVSSPLSPVQASSQRIRIGGDHCPDLSHHESGMHTQGTDSILQWSVFDPLRPIPLLFAEENQQPPEVVPPPMLDYNTLLRLEAKYIQGIHNKNPFLDLSKLHRMILNVAENGPDWSVHTCLVTLVCAIGAINQSYPAFPVPHDPSTSTSSKETADSGDLQLSLHFWSMAAKRLGMAMALNSIESVQCFCLAGIWYMHRLQPLEAWKHFNLAGSGWHCLRLADKTPAELFQQGNESSKSFTVTQALYFTIWKSECELMLELPVPSPDLDVVRFPFAFPTPPTVDGSEPSNAEAGEDERCWYYYLAEIAARHLFNRLAHSNYDVPAVLTAVHVQQMVTEAQLMEAQVHSWYSSLPLFLHFDIPTGFNTEPHPDDMTQILQNRYISLRELIGRQFVKLCVEHSLDNIDQPLRSRVQAFASQSLQYCMLKLSQVRTYRHQGTWFGMRSTASTTLVLCGVYLAQQEPRSVGAHALVLPSGWRAKMKKAFELVGQFWAEPYGGAASMRQVLEMVMRMCADATTEGQPEQGVA